MRFGLIFLSLILSHHVGTKNSLCRAFVTPQKNWHPRVRVGARTTPIKLQALPSSFWEIPSSLITADAATATVDIPMEDAFQDSISLTDGPVGVLLAAFGLFVVLAVGFKTVMGQMDSAIEKVLADFEATLKQYYPKRWKTIETTQLAGLEGDARDVKLLQVMEELQQNEPEFMTQVANRSNSGGSNAGSESSAPKKTKTKTAATTSVVDAEIVSDDGQDTVTDSEK